MINLQFFDLSTELMTKGKLANLPLVINSVLNQTFVSTPHRHSTTVSLKSTTLSICDYLTGWKSPTRGRLTICATNQGKMY